MFAILFSPAAMAADRLTVRDSLALATALRALDGRAIVVKDGTVMQPWEFGSGSLRLRIAIDLGIVARVEQATEAARTLIIREILERKGLAEIKMGTPEFDEFTRQYTDILELPASGTDGLQRIKASELKLDRNEIPASVIAALKPVLDIDQ